MKEARGASLALLVLLLHLEHGARLGERWQRPEHGDQGRLLGEAVVEATHERMKEGAVGNHLAELTQLIADGFDALAENADRAITLSDGAELRVESIDPGVAIVLKECRSNGPRVASPESLDLSRLWASFALLCPKLKLRPPGAG